MRSKSTKTENSGTLSKTKIGLPDPDQSKASLNSLGSSESRRGYQHAMEEFIDWYCSEPRLPFNKTEVTRYRIHLENRQLAPGTINVRLAAVRRLAHEAADSGLLSPELAVGIRRVKGAKKLGVPLGNWLTAAEARTLWQLPNSKILKGKRDRATRPTFQPSSPHFHLLMCVRVRQQGDHKPEIFLGAGQQLRVKSNRIELCGPRVFLSCSIMRGDASRPIKY